MTVFGPKYIETQFGIDPSDAGIYFGKQIVAQFWQILFVTGLDDVAFSWLWKRITKANFGWKLSPSPPQKSIYICTR